MRKIAGAGKSANLTEVEGWYFCYFMEEYYLHGTISLVESEQCIVLLMWPVPVAWGDDKENVLCKE